jgi:DNA-binding transcriptional LysR family regulator
MLHRSVRKASQMLSVTPSAVSHALRRLRQSIGDELFISTESGMQPTRRALELASAVREGLEKLELALIRRTLLRERSGELSSLERRTILVWSSFRRWSKG